MTPARPRAELPSALGKWPEIRRRIDGSRLAVFLDYDGVLTPIVEHPDLATLGSATRRLISDLAAVVSIAVVSGRGLADVRAKVDLPDIYYAGSHGLEIVAPGGGPITDETGFSLGEVAAPLERATGLLVALLGEVEGALVERKPAAIAVHYRKIRAVDLPRVEDAVNQAAAASPELRVTTGKKVFELRPAVAWDKGKAVRLMLSQFERNHAVVTPMYLGDDTTDEDAFRELGDDGIGIVVGRDGPPTLARYALESPAEVATFLAQLEEALPASE